MSEEDGSGARFGIALLAPVGLVPDSGATNRNRSHTPDEAMEMPDLRAGIAILYDYLMTGNR